MAERLKPLRGDGAKLLKLVSEAQDTQTLEQALELGRALGQSAEGLLDGIEVTAGGELLLSSRFRGTQANQPALNLLLMQQLSLAPEGSPEAKLRRSVFHLNLVCQIAPTLRGFDGLESLSLNLVEGARWQDLSNCGKFNSLLSFSLIHHQSKEQPCTVVSLNGLNAPLLQNLFVSGLGLTSVEALSTSTCLIHVDLSNNTELLSISGLKSSAQTLETLSLEACSLLSSIEPLEGATGLQSINLKECTKLQSLKPLLASQNLQKIILQGCAQIDSLEGLSSRELEPSGYHHFSLEGCTSLISLRGLPHLSEEISTLYLQNMPALVSLDGIEVASAIETLDIDNTALTHLKGLERLQSLANLTLRDCDQLLDITPLGQLKNLSNVHFYDCSQIKLMPPKWGPMLRSLQFKAGNFSSLGELPESLEDLEVRGVATLLNLKGIENSTSLKVASVDTFLKDATALRGLPNVYLRCSGSSAGRVTSTWLQTAAGRLNPLRLDLVFANLEELQILVEFPQLQAVHIGYQATEFYNLKVGEYLTETAVRTLQRVICKKHKLNSPEFLKPRRISNKAIVEGGPSLVDLKRGLTSTEFAQIVEALDKLRATSSASLYDAIVEGVDASTLYTGDTKALGKLFKDIHAPFRPWARWALTHILMDAPDEATRAVSIRDQLESMVLTVSLSFGQDPARSLPLARFKSLQSITLHGLSGNDLSFLKEAGPLKSLTILDMKDLNSLESLASMKSLTSLESLSVQQCPRLLTLQGLESANVMKCLVIEGSEQISDFSAMSGMRSLKGFPGRFYGLEIVDLSNFKALSDIQFASGLQDATSLKFKLTGRVDLSPLARLDNLQSVKLELDTLNQDFLPLARMRELEIELMDHKTGYAISSTKKPKAEHQYIWSGELPMLEKLRIDGGQHDTAQLRAPRLNSFFTYSRVPSLIGVGHASEIHFQMSSCGSLNGLEESPIESLDIYYSSHEHKSLPSLKILHKLPCLKKLRIGSGLTDVHAKELTACANIQSLETTNFSGSISFLKGWTQLSFLDLRNSGELVNLEALCDLPALTEIRLRGSAMKRDTWPKALQDRLNFKS